MSSDQLFWLEVLKLVVPVAAATLAYLTLRQSQAVKSELGIVRKQIDGQATALNEAIGKASYSEGVAVGVAAVTGGIAAVTPAPPSILPIVINGPPAISVSTQGGRRAGDPPLPP